MQDKEDLARQAEAHTQREKTREEMAARKKMDKAEVLKIKRETAQAMKKREMQEVSRCV